MADLRCGAEGRGHGTRSGSRPPSRLTTAGPPATACCGESDGPEAGAREDGGPVGPRSGSDAACVSAGGRQKTHVLRIARIACIVSRARHREFVVSGHVVCKRRGRRHGEIVIGELAGGRAAAVGPAVRVRPAPTRPPREAIGVRRARVHGTGRRPTERDGRASAGVSAAVARRGAARSVTAVGEDLQVARERSDGCVRTNVSATGAITILHLWQALEADAALRVPLADELPRSYAFSPAELAPEPRIAGGVVQARERLAKVARPEATEALGAGAAVAARVSQRIARRQEGAHERRGREPPHAHRTSVAQRGARRPNRTSVDAAGGPCGRSSMTKPQLT